MEMPERIRQAAERLKQGRRVNHITVRDFLRYFDAERRGAVKVEAIRGILDELQIQTDPDFTKVWIDAPIWFKLKNGFGDSEAFPPSGEESARPAEPSVHHEKAVLEGPSAAVFHTEVQAEEAPISTGAENSTPVNSAKHKSIGDPTFRIGNFPAANKKLVVVNQHDQLGKAVTLMLQHDSAQLPVMQGEREVKGIITWKSIASKKALECRCERVEDCSEEASIVDSNRTLFEAIPSIIEQGYVLVRDRSNRKITGMVTTSDLSLQLQTLTEPFLLLREVELHLRELLQGELSAEDLNEVVSKNPDAHKIENVADLTFGEYVRLFERPDIWEKVGLNIDKSTLTKLLEEVREIRNDVMHFDPDPFSVDHLMTLKQASRFMQDLFALRP